jgi:flagellar hook-associated protein 2
MHAYLAEALQTRVNELFENPPANGDYMSIANPKISVGAVTNTVTDVDGVTTTSYRLNFTAAAGSTLTMSYLTDPATVNQEDYATQAEYDQAVEDAHNATGLGKLGFTDGDSNRINIYSTELKNLKINGTLVSPTPTTNSDGTTSNNYVFFINDTRISVGENESVSNLINKINASDAGVTLSYSEATDRFTLTAKTTGAGKNIDMDVTGDTNGNLLGALLGLQNGVTPPNQGAATGNESTMTQGMNAIVYIDGVKIERTSNEFTLNGIAFSLKETYNTTYDPTKDPATAGESVTLASDGTDLVETVKTFVEDYNALIDLLYKYTSEETFSDYEPLTEEERAAMSESQIALWEEKAKSGLLRNDSTLNKIASGLREAFLSAIDGFGLYSMGITYGGWQDNGKLKITDEAKLKEVLESNPDRVRDYFTNASKGVAVKLDTVIENAVRTTGGEGYRGSLIELAGWPSTMSEEENSIYTQMLSYNKNITAFKERLEAEETRLWTQFTAMETALASLNEQSSLLSSYLGTGTSS